jgi:hypothetical protein
MCLFRLQIVRKTFLIRFSIVLFTDVSYEVKGKGSGGIEPSAQVESMSLGNIALKLKKIEIMAFGRIWKCHVYNLLQNQALTDGRAAVLLLQMCTQASRPSSNKHPVMPLHHFSVISFAWEWKQSADLPQQLSKSFLSSVYVADFFFLFSVFWF